MLKIVDYIVDSGPNVMRYGPIVELGGTQTGWVTGNADSIRLKVESDEEIDAFSLAMLNSMHLNGVPDYVSRAAADARYQHGRSSLAPFLRAGRAGMRPEEMIDLVREVNITPTNPNCHTPTEFDVLAGVTISPGKARVVSCPYERRGRDGYCNTQYESAAKAVLKTGDELALSPQAAVPVAAIFNAPMFVGRKNVRSMMVGEIHPCTCGYVAVLETDDELLAVTGLGSDIGYHGLMTPVTRGPIRKIMLGSYGKGVPHDDGCGFYTVVPVGRDSEGRELCQRVPHSYESFMQTLNAMGRETGRMPPVDRMGILFKHMGNQQYTSQGYAVFEGVTYAIRDADILPLSRVFGLEPEMISGQ